MGLFDKLISSSTPKQKKENKKVDAKPKENTKGNTIFEFASHWSDDYYASAVSSKTRYQVLAFFALTLAGLQAIAIIFMMPLKKEIPIAINHFDDGYVSVTPITNAKAPKAKAQVESELVRYITARESFSLNSYPIQFSLVNLLSSTDVSDNYMQQQSSSNQDSFLNTLGADGFRKVHIDSVNFLDRSNWVDKHPTGIPHKNLAQVDYTVTSKKAGHEVEKGYSVLIGWDYTGIPNSPEDRWRNWDGFTVTSYQNNQRNI
ncbi:MAG: hypothetical protein CMF49_00060 [Legionellales bacterium]|nr:hypothetical protein [Legionellales bacterium]|tara:strand:- start:221 stop:1000 length:780 start_codon:yes stop_codon:yes gene_type:complete